MWDAGPGNVGGHHVIRRWAFKFVAAASLLICLAMVSLWVISYSRTSRLSVFSFGEFHAGGVLRGRLFIVREYRRRPPGTVPEVKLDYGLIALPSDPDGPRESEVPQVFSIGGVEGWRGSFIGRWRSTYVVPMWIVVLTTLIIPIFYLRRRWQLRPIVPGHCRGCGYNLTGNTSGVCPECGRAFERRTMP